MPKRDYNRVFQTAEVAAALNVPEWRIIKFVQGKEYRLRPSIGDARGTGTRRLYDILDVYKMGVAEKLLEDGFRPIFIGKVIWRLFRAPNLEIWPEVRFPKDATERTAEFRGDRVLAIRFTPSGRRKLTKRAHLPLSPIVEITAIHKLASRDPSETNCYFLWLDRLLDQIDDRIWGKKTRR